MVRPLLIACCIFSCAPAPDTSNVSIPFPLTKAQCTLPTPLSVKARVLFEGFATPCELRLQQQTATGDFSTTGECRAIPITIGKCGPGTACAAPTDPAACRALNNPDCTWGTLVTLQWYVLSPTSREVILAESLGRANISEPEQGKTIFEIEFKPEVASQRPKTEAFPTESNTEKDRFNCDRSGENFCDKAGPFPTVAAGAEADNCSNLEELCMGTLFTQANNMCN